MPNPEPKQTPIFSVYAIWTASGLPTRPGTPREHHEVYIRASGGFTDLERAIKHRERLNKKYTDRKHVLVRGYSPGWLDGATCDQVTDEQLDGMC